MKKLIMYAAFVLLMQLSCAMAQGPRLVDYFIETGSCELDLQKDNLADGWGITLSNVSSNQLMYRLDGSASGYSQGNYAQVVQVNRTGSNPAGSVVLNVLARAYGGFMPKPNRQLSLQFALKLADLQNANYDVYTIRNGQPHYFLRAATENHGWREYIYPITVDEYDSSQGWSFSFRIRINLPAGANSAKLWIDNLRLLASHPYVPYASLPNGIKLYSVTFDGGWQEYASYGAPIGLLQETNRAAAGIAYYQPGCDYMLNTSIVCSLMDSTAEHNRDIFGYYFCDLYRPDWFLKYASNGARVTAGSYLDRLLMNVGRLDVRQQAWLKLYDYWLRAGRPSMAFLDHFGTAVALDGAWAWSPCPYQGYATMGDWWGAIGAHFSYLSEQIKKSNIPLTLVLNLGSNPGTFLPAETGIQETSGPGILTHRWEGEDYRWIENLNGFVIEHAFSKYDTATQSYVLYPYRQPISNNNSLERWYARSWRMHLRAITQHQDKIIPVIVTMDVNNQQAVRFVVATYLLAQHQGTYLKLSGREGPGQRHPTCAVVPELFMPLGNYTGDYEVIQGSFITGGLFYRQYENGFVLVNPTDPGTGTTYQFTMPATMLLWNSQLVLQGQTIAIPPKTGMVFVYPSAGLLGSPDEF
ncbi:MAG: hypothetical protein KIT45_02180 [Fimbriimonadia bacterium]|nr:hypothetical protein [Fimbriimonadia bacterium]